MEITDPRWPSLREAGRRFLKHPNVILSIPTNKRTDAHKLIQEISDNIPSKLDLPEIIDGDFSIIGLAEFGKEQPSMGVCWVPDCKWDDFFTTVIQLLEAGYPGCVGCGGADAEDAWDEAARRSQFLK